MNVGNTWSRVEVIHSAFLLECIRHVRWCAMQYMENKWTFLNRTLITLPQIVQEPTSAENHYYPPAQFRMSWNFTIVLQINHRQAPSLGLTGQDENALTGWDSFTVWWYQDLYYLPLPNLCEVTQCSYGILQNDFYLTHSEEFSIYGFVLKEAIQISCKGMWNDIGSELGSIGGNIYQTVTLMELII